jgi:hypothetical protein
MDVLTCNWQMDEKVKDGEVIRPEGPCGKQAVAIYSKLNPKRRQPDQPRFLTYPACRVHDPPGRQKQAKETGYEREVL